MWAKMAVRLMEKIFVYIPSFMDYVLYYTSMRTYCRQTEIVYNGYVPKTLKVTSEGIFSGALGDKRADVNSWMEGPHVAFANLRLSAPKAIADFIKKYGPPSGTVSRPENGRTSGGEGDDLHRQRLADSDCSDFTELEFRLEVRDLTQGQSALRLAWRGDYLALMAIRQGATGIFRFKPPDANARSEFGTHDLTRYMCCLFVIDHAEGKTKFCKNPTCTHPYFVQRRKRQEHCSHGCAVLVAVRRSRERAAGEQAQPRRKP